MYKGIDVSSNNGKLDWDKILADGIQFAIIRIGYGSDQADQDDTQAIRNMQECESIGLPYGVYIYSYALNEDNAKSEAQHTLRMIQGFNPSLGVFFDMEDADGYKARNGLVPQNNGSILTDFCCLFCDEVASNGYKVGIYANKYFFDSILDISRFDNYMKWLAIWGPDEVPEGDWILWQYTSDGVVQGSNARTDMNYFYGELPQISPQVEEVNTEEENAAEIEPQEVTEAYEVGEEVSVLNNSTYDGGSFTTYYDTYQIIECHGDRAVIGIDGQVTTAINISNIARLDDTQLEVEETQEENVPQSNIEVGSTVIVINNEQYTGGEFTVYFDTYTVMELNGDRAVIGIDGVVTTAINICNLQLA